MGNLKLEVEIRQKLFLFGLSRVSRKKNNITKAGNDWPQNLKHSHAFNRNLTRKLLNSISFFGRVECFVATPYFPPLIKVTFAVENVKHMKKAQRKK